MTQMTTPRLRRTPPTEGNLPQLRFPEFKDLGVWEENVLSALLDYQQPTEYLVSDTNYSDSYKTPVLTAGKTFILGYTNEQNGIFSKDLPIIIFDDFTTATQFVDFPFKAKSSAMKILQAKNGVSIKFMYELLQMISYEVGTHERHWISKFAPMVILAPGLPEQQKIAACLSSLDDLITAEKQQLEALKTHKKGLMQSLFPAEGETVPKHRFPEFKNAGAWEEKKIGSICGFIVPGRNKPEYFDGDIPWITTPDIEQNKRVSQSKKNLCVSKDEAKAVGSKIVPENAIIMSCVGDLGLVAIAGCELVINQQLHAFIANEGYSYRFLLYALTNKKSYMEKVATKTAVPYMNKDTCNSIPVSVPSFPEQQKIAACLSSLDDLISAQSQKIEALKQHKKGLMQQLFPNANLKT